VRPGHDQCGRLYDVSSTHVSQLISEAFKYSHLVLASVTYNLGIYPAMHNFLMDMKALNVQNRTSPLWKTAPGPPTPAC
jgi:flavorubredoxin